MVNPATPALVDSHNGFTITHGDLPSVIATWADRIKSALGEYFKHCCYVVNSLPKTAAAVLACRVIEHLGCAFVMNDFNDEEEIARRVMPLFTLTPHDAPVPAETTPYYTVRVNVDTCDIVDVIAPTAEAKKEPEQFEDPDILYITFSSGSTGLPKGIIGSKRCVRNMYEGRWGRYPNRENWVVAANVFFIWECFRPIENGETCLVVRSDQFVDPQQLRAVLEKFAVTEILFTPSYARLYVSGQRDTPPPPTLQRVYMNGEVVTAALRQQLIDHFSAESELLNLYSISECYEVASGNLREDCVDMDVFPKVGCEICAETEEIIAHTPVAHGYHKGGETEMAVFDTENWKFYRTSDRGNIIQHLPDEEIPFGCELTDASSKWAKKIAVVGRCNNNVRVKGRWAQLEAIQDIVEDALGVKHGLVTAKMDDDGQLVAYIDGQYNPEAIAEVRHKLPFSEWMPDRFVPNSPTVRLPAASGKQGKEEAEVPKEKLRNLLYRHLGVDVNALTKRTSLRDLGVTSLSILRLQKALQDEAGLKFSVTDLYRIADVRQFTAETVTPDFLRQEVSMIRTSAAAMPAPPALDGEDTRNAYFVTGATGYLGGWVVNHLAAVMKTEAKVYLMCRKSEEQVRAQFETRGLQVPKNAIFLQGDNALPVFGLSRVQQAQIRGEVKYYVHCAAHVVFGCSYSEARAGTVGGAEALIRLVLGSSRGAEVHYVSTNGVYPPGFTASNGGKPCRESQEDFDLYAQTLKEGYGWSKWVAERAVVECCADAGVPCRAYRPGNIGWSKDGRVNPTDFQTLIVFACRAIAARPAVTGWNFEITPVDELAAFIAEKCGSNGTAIHNCIGSRVPMAEYFEESVQPLPMCEWVALARRLTNADGSVADFKSEMSPRDLDAVKQTVASFEEYDTLDMYLADTNDYATESSLHYTPEKAYMMAV